MFKNKNLRSKLCIVMSIIIALSVVFAFNGFADNSNLALKKTVKASSTYNTDYRVKNAVDGDLDTSWYAAPDKATAKLTLDLGASHKVSLIKIFWGIYDYATKYELYYTNAETPASTDWVKLNASSITNTMYKAHYVSELKVSETVRQIRIDCKAKNDWSYEIFEVEVYPSEAFTTTTAIPTTVVTEPTEAEKPTTLPTDETAEPFEVSRDMNHAYVPYEWLELNFSEERINKELDTLAKHKIKYLLCDIGTYEYDYEKNVLTNSIKTSELAKWIKLGHERGMIVSACINFGLTDKIVSYDTVTEFGTKAKNQIVNLTKKLVNTGLVYGGETYFVDGIHFDAEPFEAMYQTYLLTLLKATRNVTAPQGKMISLYSPAKNGLWSDAYLRKIINVVDMINPALYDSNGSVSWGDFSNGVTQTKEEYMRLCELTCIWYSNNIQKSANPDCMLSPTVPVYDDRKASGNVDIGFPYKNSGEIYYHLNYNEVTGEELESLNNAITAINSAAQKGAHVYSAGVFYWPAFIGQFDKYSPKENPHYDFNADMNNWQNNWVNVK